MSEGLASINQIEKRQQQQSVQTENKRTKHRQEERRANRYGLS